jgi:hypothetical protein
MNKAEVVVTLTERRDYLSGRILLKMERGWEYQWDERERNALDEAIAVLKALDS